MPDFLLLVLQLSVVGLYGFLYVRLEVFVLVLKLLNFLLQREHFFLHVEDFASCILQLILVVAQLGL